MRIMVESNGVLEMVMSQLKANDVLVVKSVKVMGDCKEQALKRYIRLLNCGVIIYLINEPNLSTVALQKNIFHSQW